jgi:hypothetical protein
LRFKAKVDGVDGVDFGTTPGLRQITERNREENAKLGLNISPFAVTVS